MKITNKEHPQDVDMLRAEAYPSSGEQHGATQKVLKVIFDQFPQVLERVKAEAPDALAVIGEVDVVKADIPKPRVRK